MRDIKKKDFKNRDFKKRSQIMGEIFVWILGSVVVILILFFGYKAITSLRGKACDVEKVNFEKKLSNSIDTISTDYKSQLRLELQLPCSYTQVCLIDHAKANAFPSETVYTGPPNNYDVSGLNPIIRNSVFDPDVPSRPEVNVYLIDKQGNDIYEFDAGNFTLDVPAATANTGNVYYCQGMQDGKIILKLEGLGDLAQISPWPALP